MANRTMMSADEIVEELEISKTYAYKLIRQFNEELEKKGFVTICGKVSRKYFMERFYGMNEMNEQKGA